MRTSLMLVLALAASACSASGGVSVNGPGPDGTITIDNASTHVLTEVRVAPVGQVDWGPNLLPDVLYPDEQLTVSVACDTYDVLVSDDRGRDCELDSLDLCFSDSIWTVDNSTLRNCGF
jgi:hypothetical protein